MSLGIFSIDLAAIIRSLSDFVNIADQSGSPANIASAIDQVENILQDASDSDVKMDDIAIAAALEQTITSVLAAPKEDPKKPTAVVPQPVKPVQSGLDEETRLEIERLIKSLQTSVVHNYRSSDMIDETVSLERVQHFPRRHENENSDDDDRKRTDERRRDDIRLQNLRDEFRREMLRNNSAV